MSGLAYLGEYGSDSEDSVSDLEETRRNKFPVPDLSHIPVVPSDTHEDNPKLHGGRKRSFPHVRGNWPSYVYVNYPQNDILINLINKLKSIASSQGSFWVICEDLHISLSKTVILLYHWISSFNTSIQKSLSTIESFELGFSGVKVLCNEDSTRTFIVLEVDCFSQKQLHLITKEIDKVLSEFNLPLFYDKPSFHMSVLWVNGNKKKEIVKFIDKFNDLLVSELNKDLKTVLVDKISCKIGNKYFQYNLL
ncbi:U6 snRNA phosphodiesterase isoform X3 [Manduca sexta]|uniref:U6 snRNA phosphodiesterase isoform X3 n=1 Tax=Manduca sexta TaxID=7130 RepID=UPI001183FB64|nr:U6 snRNA phosphodiesterase isoform X3 [Manduca sexta]